MSLELIVALFREKGRPVVRRLASGRPGDPEDEIVVPEPIDPEDETVVPQPIDPEEEIVVPEPIDPEEEIVVPEPIDPEEEIVVPEPIDPEEEIVVPEPIDPEEEIVVPEPIDPQSAAQLLARAGGCGSGCGCGRHRRRRRPPEYSGSLVVRLAERPVPAPGTGSEEFAAPSGGGAGEPGSGLDSGGREEDPRCAEPPPPPPADELFRRRREEALAAIERTERDEQGEPHPGGERERSRQRRALDALRTLDVEPLIRSLAPQQIRDLERKAASSDFPPVHSLASYCRLDAASLPGPLARDVVRLLDGMPWVDLAYRELAARDPSLRELQHYLDGRPVGIGAREAWRMLGEGKAAVRVVDLEQGWGPPPGPHGELPGLPDPLHNHNRALHDGLYRGDHGTAVVGQLVAEHTDPDLGVQGIAPGFELRLLSHYRKDEGSNGHVADAVLAAVAAVVDETLDDEGQRVLAAGDVLLVEVQRAYRPCEIDHADFEALRLASAHGLVVVEAAGNGGHDLDAYRDERGRAILARGRSGYRESGALVVGAASDGPGHDRLPSSCFGRRVDCFGWGRGVVTAGYGDLAADGTAPQGDYTRRFSGTSAAAPMVAGVAALVQEAHLRVAGNRLSNRELRVLLADPGTGTRQGRRVRGAIGVMPDAGAILRRLGLGTAVRLARPDELAGHADRHAIAPDPANGGHRVLACNDGSAPVEAKAILFHGPVSPLVFPDRWNRLGSPAGKEVPPGGPPVDLGPVPGAPERASFLALIDDGSRPAPSLPPASAPYFRLGDHFRCLRRHTAQCDVEVAASAAGEESFFLFGSPDGPRTFTFELVRRLGHDVEITLEAPAFLVSELARGRAWERPAPRVVGLPRRPHVRTSPVRLPRGEPATGEPGTPGNGFECKLAFSGAAPKPGDSFTWIQRWRGHEVGRVTWRFV